MKYRLMFMLEMVFEFLVIVGVRIFKFQTLRYMAFEFLPGLPMFHIPWSRVQRPVRLFVGICKKRQTTLLRKYVLMQL